MVSFLFFLGGLIASDTYTMRHNAAFVKDYFKLFFTGLNRACGEGIGGGGVLPPGI